MQIEPYSSNLTSVFGLHAGDDTQPTAGVTNVLVPEKWSYRLLQTALVSFKPQQNNKQQFMAVFC